MYLLDTNHCSRLIQGNKSIVKKIAQIHCSLISTCVICRGELIYMAEKSQKVEENLIHINNFLNDIKIYSIDNKTADIYGKIKVLLLNKFGPKKKSERRKITTVKLGFGENDIWIASIAKRYDLTVVSTDGDFKRLSEVIDLDIETWLCKYRRADEL